MLSRGTVSAVGAMVALLFGASLVFAQQAQESAEQKVLSTEYKPLTLWRKVTIGGAYYTDPNFVSNLGFTYGYDIKDIPINVKDQIPKLIKDGIVAPAIVNPETGNAHIISVADVSELEAAGKGHGLILLSKKNTLLGQSSSTNWVTYFKATTN